MQTKTAVAEVIDDHIWIDSTRNRAKIPALFYPEYNEKMMKFLTALAIVGNIVYVLWITYNGLDEGFSGSAVQSVSYIGIMLLLALDAVLLIRKSK